MIDPSLLLSLPLFAHLSKEDQALITAEIDVMPYGKGDYIFREGDTAEWFHIVQEGTVKCIKSTPDGRDMTLKVLAPGDLFCCEAAVLDGSSHPGCAKVLDQARIVRIPKKRYLEILKQNPDAAIHVINYLAERLREAQEQAKAMVFHKAERRLASILYALAQKAGVSDPEGVRLKTRVTRRDLADMAGLTVETATRIIGRFKSDQILFGTAKRIVIRDMKQLPSPCLPPILQFLYVFPFIFLIL